MTLLLLAIGLPFVGAVLAPLCVRRPRWAARVAAACTLTGCALGMLPAVVAITSATPLELRLAWNIPYGSFHIGLDALSGFFLIPIFVLSAAGTVYGLGYLKPEPQRSRVDAWAFYNILVASMALVVVARNGVLFLIAWEAMALSSFFLVTHELVSARGESRRVGEAGNVYLVATHLGSAFLLVLFVLLGRASGSLEFETFTADPTLAPAGLAFILALIGFGSKAGFWPMHVWLPEAHPVAPSHVSALMSGVMIKTGIYGILRTLSFLGPPEPWWGWVLVAIGITSGIPGVLFALAQHDLKRLLAYHSVENIGIIALGLGVGLIGQQTGMPVVAALGYAGALLHVINHALFKGLLFLAAGSVAHGTGTLNIEDLGGLARRMPWTAALFLIGAVAISGLPPLNGFVSELCIYLGAFHGVGAGHSVPVLTVVIAGLALIGGLAVACFTKAFGVVFLGRPRSEQAVHAHEAGTLMLISMSALALACVGVAFFAWALLPHLAPLVGSIAHTDASMPLAHMSKVLASVAACGLALALGVAGLAILRNRILRDRRVDGAPTWGCAYPAPTPRMQYTASSYAAPLTGLFRPLLRTRVHIEPPQGYFPHAASFASHTDDVASVWIYRPASRFIQAVAATLRWFQQGRVQLYILYIAVTLLVLLVATLGG